MTDWTVLTYMAIPAVNLVLILLIMQALRAVRRGIDQRLRETGRCLVTQDPTCLLTHHPELLCGPCRERVRAAAAALRRGRAA